MNETQNEGLPTIADQSFPPGDPGYVEDPGFPEFDPEAAKQLVEEYRAEGNDPSFVLSIQSDPAISARADQIQSQLKEVGIDVRIDAVDQATLISNAIAGNFQGMTFRLHAGGEPDAQYIWWHSKDNPINFPRIDDPEIDRALEEARAEPDQEKRVELYESIARRFSEQVYSVWLWYTPWAIGLGPNTHGVLPESLPDGGGEPWTGLAGGHPVHGMWVEQ